MASASSDSGDGKMTGDLLGSMPDEAGPAHSRPWSWSSTSTSPGELAWDEDSSDPEPTLEDPLHRSSPAEAAPSFSAVVGQIQGLEESGDFDLTPLRHLLEQGWADPGTARSKSDFQPTAAPRAGAWHAQGAPSEAETVEVKTVAPVPSVAAAAPPPSMALPSGADFPDLVMDSGVAKPPPRPIAPPPPKARRPFRPAMVAAVGAGLVMLVGAPLVLKNRPQAPAAASSQGGAPVGKEAQASKPAATNLAAAAAVKEAAPPVLVALDWSGLPPGSKLFWQGQRTDVGSLGSVAPGKYDVKIVPPSRPSVRLALTVPSDASSVPVASKVQAAMAKQPTLSLALAKAPKAAVVVKVRELGENASFKTSTKLQGKNSSGVVLPKAGKYKIEVAETGTHQAYGQTVTVEEGSKKSLQIALKAAPPPITRSAPAEPSYSGGGRGYSEPTYYAPPPPAYHGGGGGGGGRIAPPSF